MDDSTNLSDDATQDATYRMRVLAKIDRGLAQQAAGNTVSLDEVRRRLSPFLTSGEHTNGGV